MSPGALAARAICYARSIGDVEAENDAIAEAVELLKPLTEEEHRDICSEWYARHAGAKDIPVCASCGSWNAKLSYRPVPIEELHNTCFEFGERDYDVLKVMEQFKIPLPANAGYVTWAELASYTLIDKATGTVSEGPLDTSRHVGFWLYPDFVHPTETQLCGSCTPYIKLQATPPGSLARGVDYGCFKPSRCANVTLCDDDVELGSLERLVVSRVRRVAISATLTCGGKEHTTYSGHVISFPQHVDVSRNSACIADVVADAISNCTIVLTGPVADRKITRARLVRNEVREFRIRPTRVVVWLALTKALRNTHDVDVELGRIANIGDEWPERIEHFRKRCTFDFRDSVNATTIEDFDAYAYMTATDEDVRALEDLLTEDSLAALMEKCCQEVDDEEPDDAEAAEHIAPTNINGTRENVEGGVTRSVVFDLPANNTNTLERLLAQMNTTMVPRDDVPLVEYGSEQSVLYELGWPALFLLPGSAKDIRASAPLSTERVVSFYDNRFNDLDLFHTWFDMRVRHECQRTCKAAVSENDVTAFERLEAGLTREELQSWVDMQAKGEKLPVRANQLMSVVRITPPTTVSFTPAHRKHSASKIRNMARAFGPPGLFFTFNPDEVTNTTIVRMFALPTSNDAYPVKDPLNHTEATLQRSVGDELPDTGIEFLDSLKSRSTLLHKSTMHGCRIAAETDRLAKSFIEVVLGVKTTPNTYVPRAESDRGVWGSCAAACMFYEEDSKKTGHYHGIGFGFTAAAMLMEVSALSSTLQEAMRRWINSVSTVTLPDANVVYREIFRSVRERPDRVFGASSIALSSCPSQTKARGTTTATMANFHTPSHTSSCHKRGHGCVCRFGMPELHGTDRTELYLCCESGPRRGCVHDEIHVDVRYASKAEAVDIDMIPLRDCDERHEVERQLLSAYGCLDVRGLQANPPTIKISPPLDMPLTWAQARPYVTDVSHDVTERPLAVQTASWEQFIRFLSSGPAGDDDLRFRELARAMMDDADCKTHEERNATLHEIRERIKCSHGYTAPHNPFVTGLLRCNTAMKLCFNTQAASSMMHYITQYVTKVPKLLNPLGSIARAIRRYWQYGSQAEDEGTARRRAVFVTQAASQHVLATQGQQELSDTTIAMAVTNAASDYFTCEFRPLHQQRLLKDVADLIATQHASPLLDDLLEYVNDDVGVALDDSILGQPARLPRQSDAAGATLSDSGASGQWTPTAADVDALLEHDIAGFVDGDVYIEDIESECTSSDETESPASKSNSVEESTSDSDVSANWTPSSDDESSTASSELDDVHSEEGARTPLIQHEHNSNRFDATNSVRPRLKVVTGNGHGLTVRDSPVYNHVLQYAYRGQSENINLWSLCDYACMFKPVSRKGTATGKNVRRTVLAYDDRWLAAADYYQVSCNQLHIPQWSGTGRPLPKWTDVNENDDAAQAYAWFVRVFFIPWSIDALPNPDTAQQDVIAWSIEAEKPTAQWILRASYQRVQWLLHETDTTTSTKSMLDATRMRHADVLPWLRDKVDGEAEEAAALNKELRAHARTHNAEAFADVLAEMDADPKLRKALMKHIAANNELAQAMRRSTCYSESPTQEQIAAMLLENAAFRFATPDIRLASQSVLAAFTSAPAWNTHDVAIVNMAAGRPTLQPITDAAVRVVLDGATPSQTAVLRDLLAYTTALNEAHNDGLVRIVSASVGHHNHPYLTVTNSIGSPRNEFDVFDLNCIIHGGPGTGKTHIIKKFIDFFDKYSGLQSVVVAPTGAAASHHVGRGATVQTKFGESTALDEDRLNELLAMNPVSDLGLVFIDEISMVALRMLDAIDKKLRHAMRGTPRHILPFGGVPVIVAGDFFQLPPVAAQAVYALRLAKTPASRKVTHDERLDASGALLLCKFKMVFLTEQMRSLDAAHTTRLRFARAELTRDEIRDAITRGHFLPLLEPPANDDTFIPHEIVEKLFHEQISNPHRYWLANLKALDPSEEGWDLVNTDVSAVALDNNDRNELNYFRMNARARRGGGIVITWRIPNTLCDDLERTHGAEYVAALMAEENVHGRHTLFSIRIGDPAVCTKNVSVTKRVFNGALGTFFAVDWFDAAAAQRNRERISTARRSKETEVFVEPPDVIAVEFARANVGVDPDAAWPASETLVPGRVVLPFFPTSAKYKNKPNEMRVFSTRLRNENKGSNKTGCSVPMVEPALAYTQWRVQGSTVKRVALWLPKRTTPPYYSANGLYVMASRVRQAEDIRYIPHARETRYMWRHLEDKRFPKELHQWLSLFKRQPDGSARYDFNAERQLIER